MITWWGAQVIYWSEGKKIKGLLVFTGFIFIALIFYLGGLIYEKKNKLKRMAVAYYLPALIFITGILLLFSTKGGLQGLGKFTEAGSITGSWQITSSVGIFLLILLGLLVYTYKQGKIPKYELSDVAVTAGIFIVLTFLPEQKMFTGVGGCDSPLSSTGVFWALVFNVLVFLKIFGVVITGYLKKEIWIINLGAFLFFLLIIIKYFDWMFKFLDKSVFFIGAGILMFLVGWLMEKGKKLLISNIDVNKTKNNETDR